MIYGDTRRVNGMALKNRGFSQQSWLSPKPVGRGNHDKYKELPVDTVI